MGDREEENGGIPLKYIIKYEFDTRYDPPYWANATDLSGGKIDRCGHTFAQAKARLIVALKEMEAAERQHLVPPPDEEVEI